MYTERPDFVDTLAAFVRGRPAQPVDAVLAQSEAALTHDSCGVLGEIEAPTFITVRGRDLLCSTRFAKPLTGRIGRSELVVFDHLSHAGPRTAAIG
jgi:3-oxoadipate enol-lactonase